MKIKKISITWIIHVILLTRQVFNCINPKDCTKFYFKKIGQVDRPSQKPKAKHILYFNNHETIMTLHLCNHLYWKVNSCIHEYSCFVCNMSFIPLVIVFTMSLSHSWEQINQSIYQHDGYMCINECWNPPWMTKSPIGYIHSLAQHVANPLFG